MKWLPFVLSLVVAACSPVTPPCGPSTCLGGCCDAQGQCVPGSTTTTCGAAGSTCVACTAEQACLVGVCVATDAGVEVDAGPVHSVEVKQTDEYFLADSGVLVDEVDLNALPVLPLYVESEDGGWREVPRSAGSGPVLRFDGVPVGPWLFGRDGRWFMSDSDQFDLGVRANGHRRRPATAPTTLLTVQVRGLVPGIQAGDGTAIGVSSIGSGLTADTARVTASAGDETVLAAIDLSTAVQPFGLSATSGDELTVVLRRTVAAADGGAARWGAAVASAQVMAPDVGSGTTGTAEVDLVTLPQQATRLRAQTSALLGFVTDVHPRAMLGTPGVWLSAYPPSSVSGIGDFEGRTTQLGSIGSRTNDVDFTITHGNPFPGFPLLMEARLPVSVALDLGGRTFVRALDGISIVHTDRAVITPELSPPTMVLLDGQPAQTPRASTGTTPTFTWSAPTLGVPTSYLVTISRLSDASPPVETVVAKVRTPFTRLRVPPGVLTRGAPHFAVITALRSVGVDPKRWGQRGSRQTARASAMTDVFTP